MAACTHALARACTRRLATALIAAACVLAPRVLPCPTSARVQPPDRLNQSNVHNSTAGAGPTNTTTDGVDCDHFGPAKRGSTRAPTRATRATTRPGAPGAPGSGSGSGGSSSPEADQSSGAFTGAGTTQQQQSQTPRPTPNPATTRYSDWAGEGTAHTPTQRGADDGSNATSAAVPIYVLVLVFVLAVAACGYVARRGQGAARLSSAAVVLGPKEAECTHTWTPVSVPPRAHTPSPNKHSGPGRVACVEGHPMTKRSCAPATVDVGFEGIMCDMCTKDDIQDDDHYFNCAVCEYDKCRSVRVARTSPTRAPAWAQTMLPIHPSTH